MPKAVKEKPIKKASKVETKTTKNDLLIKNTPNSKQKEIVIKNAQQHNLKNISVNIPRNQFTVITGVSGSGKSSLAFDTLYAEGQRRFVESLSSYARQFLERMQKPDVESIEGLPPAISIEQLPPSRNPRSTVGTTTEIYDYLRLLFGRIGKTYCYNCNQLIKKDTPNSITESLIENYKNEKIYILFRIPENITDTVNFISYLKESGFFRVVESESDTLIDINEKTDYKFNNTTSFFLADRLAIGDDKESRARLFESIENALNFGKGRIFVKILKPQKFLYFSNIYECNHCRILYQEPEPRLFSFNNPFGACSYCQGFGKTMGIDDDLVIPDKTLSIRKNAVAPFKGQSYFSYQLDLLKALENNKTIIDKPYIDFSDDEIDLVWNGRGDYVGINGFFKDIEDKNYKIQNKVLLSRYRGYTTCKHCKGSRLRTSARQVFIAEHNVPILIKKPLSYLKNFFDNLKLSEHDLGIAEVILNELKWRITLLVDIGLEYLSLERLTHTLSGGESQRINLSSALGSSLVGTLYVLDEPSIGLHQSDTRKLINILKKIRNIGNTVVVVEHDPEIMNEADYIIDIGPKAGEKGGNLVYAGSVAEIGNCKESITGQYLSGTKQIEHSSKKRTLNNDFITIKDAKENNLKINEVSFPIGVMTVVTGVSGSGKSTLINDILYAGLKRIKGTFSGFVGTYKGIEGYQHISDVMYVDQTPIGKSSRSTPATYTKVFDYIRDLFSDTQAARQMGWRPGHFSFNTPGGRCEVCEGEGYVTVDMQFLPNISLECETCHGSRYSREVKNILYKGKSIVDVLNMTVDEALEFFKESRKISAKLLVLHDIGLGYLKLGQSSSHLSGGEAQRIKIAEFLDSSTINNNLIIFDEPTTGLHLDDISKLIKCFNKLVDKGNTIVIIEHNMNVIADADWIIDLGPGAGENGGQIVAVGTPNDIMKSKKSITGKALREMKIK